MLPDNRSPDFPQALLDLCEGLGVEVVLPIRTDDQMPICSQLEAFRDAGVEPALIVTDPELMDMLLNKRRLMEYCRDVIGTDVPRFDYATNADALTEAVMGLGYPDVPVVIKPSYSNGSRGFRVLDENIDRKHLFFNEKPTGIYSTLDDVLRDIGDEFPEMVAMEYLPGREYTVDVLCRKGKTFAVVPRLRLRMTGGITTQGVLAKDENYGVISRTVESIVEGFGLSYNVGIQLKESTSSVPLLLEVNPRLQGTTTITVAGGVNVPELMVQMALREFDYDFRPEVRWGLKMQRVWLELFEYEGRVWENSG